MKDLQKRTMKKLLKYFKQIPSAMDIFSGDLKVDDMVMAMSVFDDGKCKSIR